MHKDRQFGSDCWPGLRPAVSGFPTDQDSSGNPRGVSVSLLTPLGQGGLAAVRLFGPRALSLVGRLFLPEHGGAVCDIGPERLALGQVNDPVSGERLDRGIVRILQGGLGAELTLHGGIRIVQRVIGACEALGAVRLDAGRPGDREALWGQSFQLADAAGVARPALWADIEMALPLARTAAAVNWLIGQATVGLAAVVESVLNGPSRPGTRNLMERLLAECPSWRRAISGVRVAIVGPPNSGKTSLLNALCGTGAGVVSDQPGTTRDYVQRWINVDGLAVELVDTAGLRSAPGELEARANALADPVARSADLRLVVLDGTARPPVEAAVSLRRVAQVTPALVVVNKSDLPAGWDPSWTGWQFGGADGGMRPVRVSALTGAGLAELRRAILVVLAVRGFVPAEAGLFSERQVGLFQTALLADSWASQVGMLRKIITG